MKSLVFPLSIPPGVQVAPFRGISPTQGESHVADAVVVLLPGGSVIGPPQVTGWRPRSRSKLWAEDFNPMQALFDKKE